MRQTRRAWILALFASLLVMTIGSAAQQAAGPEAPDLVGIWLCEGVNPDGGPYQAALEIAPHGDAYTLTWAIEPMGRADGFGVLNGSALGTIYQMAGSLGYGAYLIERAGSTVRLSGRWSTPGAPVVMRETCTKTGARTLDAVKGPRRGV